MDLIKISKVWHPLVFVSVVSGGVLTWGSQSYIRAAISSGRGMKVLLVERELVCLSAAFSLIRELTVDLDDHNNIPVYE